MPVAGNNVEAFRLSVVDGRLVEDGKTRIASHMAEGDVAEAVRLLLAGHMVYLHAYGLNLVEVRRELEAQGVAVPR